MVVGECVVCEVVGVFFGVYFKRVEYDYFIICYCWSGSIWSGLCEDVGWCGKIVGEVDCGGC